MKLNSTNSNILDCGCGYARSLQFILNTKYNYNKYIGIDIDINMLGKSINKYYNNNTLFNYCNLNNINESWFSINNYFDIVLMINSIMHFSNDSFWTKINDVTMTNSIILLNVVEMDNNFKYIFGKSKEYFIERTDNTVTYKFPIHNNIKTESYIDINKYINKFGWNIIETFKSDTDNITKFYRWYILKRN